MGTIARTIRKDLFSLSTIMFVALPLMSHTGALDKVSSMMSSPTSITGMMSGIGNTEASMVTGSMSGGGGSYVVGGGPIFLPYN